MSIRIQTHRSSCIRPLAHQQSLLIQLGTTLEPCLEKHVVFSSSEGLSVPASFVNMYTHTIVRDTQINLAPDVKLHLVASELVGWYYVLQYSSYFQRYGCSCQDGKQFNHTGRACDHMRFVLQSQEVRYVLA